MPRKEKVTRIIDGDTFETGSCKNPVRLANVDAPEKVKAISLEFMTCFSWLLPT